MRLNKIILSLGAIFTSGAAFAAPAHSPEQGLLSMLPMLLIFAAVFYFLLIRPQSKRAKEQKEMMGALQLGDEILTSGGVVGRVSKLRDGYISVIIAKDTEVMLQKSAIATVLPKGTLELN